MKKMMWAPLLVVMTVALVFSSAVGQEKETPKYGGIFTFNQNGGLPKIGAVTDNLGFIGNRNSYPALEPLFITDDNENLKPWLAESWDISPDGKTITLFLRKGVKFHDGTDFNAAAVKYNLEEVYKANILGSSILGKVSSYDVLDEHTLRLNLKEYDCTLLQRLAQGTIGLIASPTAMKKPVTPETVAKLHCVGTGPFVFESWKRDHYVQYKRWDGYWRKGLPYLDGIRIQSMADLTVSLMSLRAGEVEAVDNVDPVDALQLQKEGFILQIQELHFHHSILPDGGNPNSPFADKRVRLALDYAIDKRAMAQGIGMGFYEPLGQLAYSKDPWFNPDLEYREYNPEKAKKLLAEAGYPNGFKTKIISDVMARRDALVAIQTYIKKVGIDAELEMLEFGAALAKPRQGWEGILSPGFPNVGNLPGIIQRWGDKSNYVSIYRPPGWQEKWDQLIAEQNRQKRTALLKELVKILYDEVIGIPYQADAPLQILNKKVRDWNYNSGRTVSYYDAGKIWLSE